jgi:hypothetical protein
MPAPLAPQHGVNPSYTYGPHSTTQRGRQPQPDYRMPRDAGLNAASNPGSNWYTRSSQGTPNSAERPVRINDTPSHTALISFPLFTRRAERQSNVRTHRRHGYPASNFLIQVLVITHPLQRLLLPLPTITQLAGQDLLRILLPDHTTRSHHPDILLRTLCHLV